MSDFVKWGIIGAVIVAIIATIAALPATGVLDSVFEDGGTGEVISHGLSVLSSYLVTARKVINNFVYPPAFTALLAMTFGMFFVKSAIRVGTFVIRMIYK